MKKQKIEKIKTFMLVSFCILFFPVLIILFPLIFEKEWKQAKEKGF